MELKFGIADRILYTDTELKSFVNEIVVNDFGVRSLSSLTGQQKIKLCVLMRKNYNASAKQISRITRIGLDIVNKVL